MADRTSGVAKLIADIGDLDPAAWERVRTSFEQAEALKRKQKNFNTASLLRNLE